MDINYPKICANCGTRPSETWVADVHSQITKGSSIHAILMIVRSRRIRVQTVNYEIPICYRCKEKLALYERGFQVANIVGIGICIAALAGIFGITLATVGSIFLLSLIWLVGIRILYRPNLGSYNGRYFKFPNKVYQDEFAKLNPKLVKSHFDR